MERQSASLREESWEGSHTSYRQKELGHFFLLHFSNPNR